MDPVAPPPPQDQPRPRRSHVLSVVVFLVLCGSIALLYHFVEGTRGGPVAQSRIVVPLEMGQWFRSPGTRPTDEERAVHQRNQIALARSRLVLVSALRDPKVANLSTIVNRVEPVEWLETLLKVDFNTAPDIMTISMGGAKPEELAVLVNAVTDAYLREIVDKQKTLRVQRQNALEELIRRYDNDLKVARESQRADGLKDHRVREAAITILRARVNRGDTELSMIQSKRRAILVRLGELKAKVNNVATEQIPDLEVNAALAKNVTIKALRDAIDTQEAELARIAVLMAKGKEAPPTKGIHDVIQMLQQKLGEVKEKVKPQALVELRETNRQQAQAELMTKEADLITLMETEKLLAQQIKTDQESLHKMSTYGDKIEVWREDITHLEEMAKRLKNEQEAIRVELQAPSRVEVIERGTIRRDRRGN